jgi:hypothetical protein
MNQINASRTNAADRQLQHARMNNAGEFVTLYGCFSEAQGFIVPAHWVMWDRLSWFSFATEAVASVE